MVHRILVVEDEPHIRDFLVEFLTACGHRVESAGNGSEALTLLTERSFAFILTDLHMPRRRADPWGSELGTSGEEGAWPP